MNTEIVVKNVDMRGREHSNTLWVYENDFFIGVFILIKGTDWIFRMAILSGMSSERLRRVADKLDEVNLNHCRE